MRTGEQSRCCMGKISARPHGKGTSMHLPSRLSRDRADQIGFLQIEQPERYQYTFMQSALPRSRTRSTVTADTRMRDVAEQTRRLQS